MWEGRIDVSRLSSEAIARLEQLVGAEDPVVAVGGSSSSLAELKADPGRLGLEPLLREIEKGSSRSARSA
jgi:hypothetical protein